MVKFRSLLAVMILTIALRIPLSESTSDCDEDQFECKDGLCIPENLVCNSHKDCSDGSDERDCDSKLCKKPNWFRCADGYTCIPSSKVCNGVENCPDGDDEMNCDPTVRKPHNCTDSEFTCDDHSCIPLDFMCDGKKDCHDGSDEEGGCLRAEHECPGYFCKNRKCLESHMWVCDGMDDCGDGSDEKGCAINCLLEQHKFLCADNDTCLTLSQVCDGVPDCHDSSDENGKCTTAKSECKTNSCPSKSECHALPTGQECVCQLGYRYVKSRNVCEDINECDILGVCSQICINLPGSYRCACVDKYKLKPDNKTCVVKSGEPLLLYTTQKTVMGMHLKSRHVYTVAENLSMVIGVTYDGQSIYWTDIGHETESIVKAREDGSRQEVILTAGLDTPEDLAVDWLTGNIYFSDNMLRHIAVCSNNCHYCTVLVSINVHQPRGVALWPQMGLMYWTDWGEYPMVARAGMDGSKPTAVVSKDIHWPNGITLDIPNERIYWVDAKLMKIESIKTDGTDRRTVLKDILKHPYGIAVFEDNLYWSDWSTKSIHKCNKFTGKNHEVIAKDRRIYAVHVYHSANQRRVPHPCENSHCTHLCLLASRNTSSCACPDGMALSIDGLRCVRSSKKQKLFIGYRMTILEMEHTIFGRHKVSQEYTVPMFIHQMAYNSVNGTLILVDNMHKVMIEFNPVDRSSRTLIRSGFGNITGLAFDSLAQNIYWTDSERHLVEVYSLRRKQRAIVHFFPGLDSPVALGLLPEDGKMLVALRSSTSTHIDLKTMGGYGDHTHMFEDILGMGGIQIVPDYETRIVYWLDTESRKIEFSIMDDPYAYSMRTQLPQPVSMAVIDDDVFWTAYQSPYLYWTHSSNLGIIKKTLIETPSVKFAETIQLVSTRQLPHSDHPCSHNNGACSHVCVSSGKASAKCLCPIGMVYNNAQNRTCIDAIDCEFRCQSGECLTMSRRCNGHKDCVDGSDEAFCDKKKAPVICTYDEFMCHDSLQCVSNQKRCNKVKDCVDGSDEEHCEIFDDSKKCHVHQFACDNGRCVDLSTMCDGFDDCGDGSDEDSCQKTGENVQVHCAKDMFQCTSGACIEKSWECDFRVDCSDGSDEHDRCVYPDCKSGMFKCRLGQCIDNRLVCNGHPDCNDGSDELNCEENKSKIICGSDDDEFDYFGKAKKFQCSSEPTICLDMAAKCNGTAECPRGEDEVGCHGCSINEFECKSNKECIHYEFKCDGQRDCPDGSDELNCDRYNTSTHALFVQACEPGLFDCKDGTCIDEARTCDGKKDCDNGQDELKMCKTSCAKGHPCEQKCQPTPYGAKCSCHDGYRLDGNTKCVDINECANEGNPCAQICQNTIGSYWCSCYDGFMLRPNKVSCKSQESRYTVLFTSYNEVRSLTDFPESLSVLWSVNDTKITGFDLDINRKRMYYTVDGAHTLFEYDIPSHKIKRSLSVENPSKVALDWVTSNVYIISRNTGYQIKACNFDSQLCAHIIKLSSFHVVRAIEVDALNRKLFYAAVEARTFSTPVTKISAAGLDGSKHQVLVSKNAFVTAMEADPYKKELYFLDSHSRTLQSVYYGHGTDRTVKTVIRQKNVITHPAAISIHENTAFIVNTGTGEAVRCLLYGNRECTAFNLNIFNAEDIVIDSPSRQKVVHNICKSNKCSGLCVQGTIAYECMCYDGSIVDDFYHCPRPLSNDITLGQTSSDSPLEGSTVSTTAAVCYTLLGVVIVAAIAGYFYTRNNRGLRNFNTNMHFQNPLSFLKRSSSGMGPTTSTHVGKEIIPPLPRIHHSTHGTELILETKQQSPGVQSFGDSDGSSCILLGESDADGSGSLADFDCDQRKRLVP